MHFLNIFIFVWAVFFFFFCVHTVIINQESVCAEQKMFLFLVSSCWMVEAIKIQKWLDKILTCQIKDAYSTYRS
jgi:hypothetical protein